VRPDDARSRDEKLSGDGGGHAREQEHEE